jgi:hypothetical protein
MIDPPHDARSVRLLHLPTVVEGRGALLWGEYATHLPFAPRRFWVIQGVPPGGVRGDHAHRALREVLICVRGSCVVVVDDGTGEREVALEAPERGLYIPPLVWNTQRLFSSDAVLLVLADEVYREDDYLRDRDEFRALIARERRPAADPRGTP